MGFRLLKQITCVNGWLVLNKQKTFQNVITSGFGGVRRLFIDSLGFIGGR